MESLSGDRKNLREVLDHLVVKVGFDKVILTNYKEITKDQFENGIF